MCQDKYIYHIVQLQRVMEEADAAGAHGSSAARSSDSAARTTNLPKTSHIIQLRTKLDSIKEAMPFTLMECPLLMMHYSTATVYLCHTSVCVDASLNTLPTGERWPEWRLDALGTGLTAAKSLLSYFLSLPLRSEMHFNNSEWIQLGFGMTYSARLATLSNQRAIQQETQHLRRFLGMSDILKDVSGRLKSITTSRIDDDGERDVFYHYQQRVDRLQAWFDSQSDRSELRRSNASGPTADVATFNDMESRLQQAMPSNAQLAWNSTQPYSCNEGTVTAADNTWQRDGHVELGTAGEMFPPSLIDMGNFGQYFAFDVDI